MYTYIHTHIHTHNTVKGVAAGSSPGYGVSLVAESTEGCIYGVDAVALPAQLPEDVGVRSIVCLFMYVCVYVCMYVCVCVYVCMYVRGRRRCVACTAA